MSSGLGLAITIALTRRLLALRLLALRLAPVAEGLPVLGLGLGVGMGLGSGLGLGLGLGLGPQSWGQVIT